MRTRLTRPLPLSSPKNHSLGPSARLSGDPGSKRKPWRGSFWRASPQKGRRLLLDNWAREPSALPSCQCTSLKRVNTQRLGLQTKNHHLSGFTLYSKYPPNVVLTKKEGIYTTAKLFCLQHIPEDKRSETVGHLCFRQKGVWGGGQPSEPKEKPAPPPENHSKRLAPRNSFQLDRPWPQAPDFVDRLYMCIYIYICRNIHRKSG